MRKPFVLILLLGVSVLFSSCDKTREAGEKSISGKLVGCWVDEGYLNGKLAEEYSSISNGEITNYIEFTYEGNYVEMYLDDGHSEYDLYATYKDGVLYTPSSAKWKPNGAAGYRIVDSEDDSYLVIGQWFDLDEFDIIRFINKDKFSVWGTNYLRINKFSESTTPSIHVSSVSINPVSLMLLEGASSTLKATVSPSIAASQSVWSSSDPSVATVDQYGKVTAVKAGTAIITIKCGGENAECTVFVDNNLLTPPRNKSNHTTITFGEGNPYFPSPNGECDKLEKLFIGSCQTLAVILRTFGLVLAEYEIQTTVSAGKIYYVPSFGEFTIESIVGDNVNISFLPDGATDVISLSGTFATEPYADNDFCRDWVVDETILTVEGDGLDSSLGAAKSFTGCNLNEISKYLRDKGINIDEQPASRSVKWLTLFEGGYFAILFNGERPYFGPFHLGKSGEFSYSFDYVFEDDPIIAGCANGFFTLVKESKGRLEINGNLRDKNHKNYSADVIFVLTPLE